jgi:hypothetical protein
MQERLDGKEQVMYVCSYVARYTRGLRAIRHVDI